MKFLTSVHIFFASVSSRLLAFSDWRTSVPVLSDLSHQCCFLSKETKAWGQTGFGKANESCRKEKARPGNHRYLIEWQMKQIEAQSVLQKHVLHCFSIKYQWLQSLALFWQLSFAFPNPICFFTLDETVIRFYYFFLCEKYVRHQNLCGRKKLWNYILSMLFSM